MKGEKGLLLKRLVIPVSHSVLTAAQPKRENLLVSPVPSPSHSHAVPTSRPCRPAAESAATSPHRNCMHDPHMPARRVETTRIATWLPPTPDPTRGEPRGYLGRHRGVGPARERAHVALPSLSQSNTNTTYQEGRYIPQIQCLNAASPSSRYSLHQSIIASLPQTPP